jgi:NADPH:quinone reductase-like Zn-dependent oxidoreductase
MTQGTMQAVQISQAGGPGVLQVITLPVPEPGPGEVLLRLKAASVNHLDVWLREGVLAVPLPHVPGSDGAGEVAVLGADVEGIQEGGRYLIMPGLSCGHCAPCQAGSDQYCAEFSIVGTTTPGTYAEYVVVPARNLIPIPDALHFTQAAAFPVAALTAWHLLFSRANLQPGETVLIHGVSGGVGVFAVQIAKYLGATVIATASSGEKCEAAVGIGADMVLNHGLGDVSAKVVELTDGRGADVIFDHVGAELFNGNLAALGVGGRLLVCGTTTGGDVAFNLRDLFSRQQSIHGGRLGGLAELRRVTDLFAEGHLVPVVDSTYPLAKVAEAHQLMDRRMHFGKLLLTMN